MRIFSLSSEMLLSEANLLYRKGLFQDCLPLLGELLKRFPQHSEIQCFQGDVLQQCGRFAEAVKSYKKALKITPRYPQALKHCGVALEQLGRNAEAVACYAKALALASQDAECFRNMGNALQKLNRLEEALRAYEKALEMLPSFWEAHIARGDTQQKLEKWEEALESYDTALALAPGSAVAHNNKAAACNRLGCFEQALQHAQQAAALNAGYADAYNNMAAALESLLRAPEALEAYDKAIALNPLNAVFANNKGTLLKNLGRDSEALAAYDAALLVHPAYAEACCNKAILLHSQGEYTKAEHWYEKALALDPFYAGAASGLAVLLLVLGQYEGGWKRYESRFRMPGYGNLPQGQPHWLGKECIAGKTLLLHAEQGLGDTIQFCRYAPLACGQGAKVILAVQKPLIGLLSTLPGEYIFSDMDFPLPPHDLYCPLMSLPLAFGTMLDTIPANIPYLYATPEKIRTWKERLGSPLAPRIGLAWSGSGGHKNDKNRSIKLEMLAPLLALPYEFHCLQKEVRDNDAAFLAQSNVLSHAEALQDFSDTAALVEHMDLVLSVDTSIAHLVGAMGKPLWLMLPDVPDFRWLLHREDSPWYPSARLFRREENEGWEPLIIRICAEIPSYI